MDAVRVTDFGRGVLAALVYWAVDELLVTGSVPVGSRRNIETQEHQ